MPKIVARGWSRRPLLLALLVTGGLGSHVAGPPVRAAQDPGGLRGDVENGKVLFEDNTCFGCHGYTGETGRGPRLNPSRLNQERFIAYLRNPPTPRRMPPYQQAEVSDQKLADIYAFLVSLRSASPEAESIPLLNEILTPVVAAHRPGSGDFQLPMSRGCRSWACEWWATRSCLARGTAWSARRRSSRRRSLRRSQQATGVRRETPSASLNG